MLRHLTGDALWLAVAYSCIIDNNAFIGCAGGLDKKRKHFIEGGQAGNREQYINNLVRVMN